MPPSKKPRRDDLIGLSASEFKTLLKLHGFHVPRDFYKRGSVARLGSRLYRFRYWSKPDFMVDISCQRSEFDRWANSVDRSTLFSEWIKSIGS